MLTLAINTGLHILAGITIFIMLALEYYILKRELTYQELRTLSKIDGIYGLAAILVVASGLLNWLELGKGHEYYINNIFFITKFSIFTAVGLISIYPTVIFAKTKNRHKHQPPDLILLENYPRLKKLILAELFLMVSIPILATLMANGINI